MHVEPHHSIKDLERLAKKEKRARIAERMRGVILALHGHDAPPLRGCSPARVGPCSSGSTGTTPSEYDWVYLYGAVYPATGESVGMVAGLVGIEWMNIHLRWISEHVKSTPAGELVHVVLIMDQAGWHTSKKLKVPDNITLLF